MSLLQNHPVSDFVKGIFMGIANIMPGVSGSLFSQNFYLLLPFGVGIVPGIFLFSRLLEYLFRTHAAAVYSAVLGLIAASPAAILIHTGSLSGTLTARLLPGIAVFIFCIFISKKFED